jgi:hypothetical protein
LSKTTFVVGPEVYFAADLGVAFVAAQPEVVSASAETQVSAAALESGAAAVDPKIVSVVVAPEVASASVETEVSAAALESGSVAVDPKIVSVVAAPEVVSASVETEVSAAAPEAGSAVVDPKVVSVVAQPEVSFDIAVAFVVLVPASVVVAEADSSGRPRFLAFPNADHFASFSSSVEVVGEESVRSPIGVHTNCGLCSILSIQDLHQNRNLG